MKTTKILDQWVEADEQTNTAYLYTMSLNKGGEKLIRGEPITVEEAAQWVAENKF